MDPKRKQLNFTPQQLRSIKMAPKGALPRFLQNAPQRPTLDNRITNNLVRRGKLPQNRKEIY